MAGSISERCSGGSVGAALGDGGPREGVGVDLPPVVGHRREFEALLSHGVVIVSFALASAADSWIYKESTADGMTSA